MALWLVAAWSGALAGAAAGGWALAAGLLSSLLFFFSEWLHQLGHALVAWLVGYPMVGIHYFSIFSSSLYPPEPPLPPATHIRRALGGFWVNVILGLLLLPVAQYLWPRGREMLPDMVSLLAWLAGFGVVTNLVVLGLGALVPLKFPGAGLTDGGTLLQHWRAARRR